MTPDLPAVINEVFSPRLAEEGITFTFERDALGDGYRLRLISGEASTTHYMPDESLGYYVEDLHYYVDSFLTEAVKIHKDAVEDAKEKPLFTEAVVGFRKFKLADWVLGPLNYGYPWRPGENTARCLPKQDTLWGHGYQQDRPGHEHAPHKDCHCGLNAFFEPHDIKEGGDVTAAVIGWGDMRVHPDGWRAEKARIVALLNNSLNLDEVARLYNVPIVVDMEALQMKASEFGTPLPKSLRPKEQVGPTTQLSQVLKQSWVSSNTFSGSLPAPGSLQYYNRPPYPTTPNPFSLTSAKEKARKKKEADYNRERLRKAAALYKQSKYGSPPSHGMRMDEMMEKVKELNAKKADLNKALNPPNPKKKPPWPRKK